MKKLFIKFSVLAILIVSASCAEKAKEAETKDAEKAAMSKATAVSFTADAENSVIEWKGFKPTGSHNGTIKINNGEINVNDNAIESGNFSINMNSIVVTDIPAEDEANGKLAGHLKSADFFDVDLYPSANFVVTGVKTTDDGLTYLYGNLTMKDTTNNIRIPVTTSIEGDKMMLTSETFTIDRSKWNVKYGSKSFFDNLGDKFINDDFELKVTLVANKV